MRIKTLIFLMLIICSCSTNNKTFNDNGKIYYKEVLAIKFMGTITTQPYAVIEKSFWAFTDEHVYLKIRNNGFINDVKDLKNNSFDKFNELNYAFIVRNKKSVDTLYSDNTLKSWIYKKNKKEYYYYDEEGKIAENLRNTYSFFNDCW
ncbi:hypothetical protein ACFSJW_13385 [Flavobacterium artemisiae]|uniref:DKNYY family protein n=1 Tax=Flavobacterium artemisiae TaxID=2126556 RepID=A0ABW4HG98_9FLAO